MDLPTVSTLCRARQKHTIIYRVFSVMEECLHRISLQDHHNGHCPLEECEYITPWRTVLVGVQCAHCQGLYMQSLGVNPFYPRRPVEEIILTGHLSEAPNAAFYPQPDQVYTAMEILCRVPLRVLNFLGPYRHADGPTALHGEEDVRYEVEIDEQADHLLNVHVSGPEQG